MRLMRFIGAASLAGAITMAMAGTAAADVSIGNTGPSSKQDVNIENSSSVITTNTNDVQIVNASSQKADTGNVAANENTAVSGGLGSGQATNESSTATTVTIGNQQPGSGNGNPGSGGSVGSGGAVPGSGGNVPAPGKGGSVLGASVTPGMGAGEAILPVTGATVPVDVSALRAAWHDATPAARTLVNQTQAISQWLLALAGLLSLIGAAVSVIYARRQEGRS